MDIQKTILPNGLRVVTASMPSRYGAYVGLLVRVGSRYETEAQRGISHFIEHMLLKGTESRPTPEKLLEDIEWVGGGIDDDATATGEETTYYGIYVPHGDLHVALDLLADVILHPLFDERNIKSERAAIAEEERGRRDDPNKMASDLLKELLWPNHPLAWTVAGTEETLRSFTRDDLLKFMADHYIPQNIVVSVAGSVAHDEVVDLVAAKFGDWPAGEPVTCVPVGNAQSAPQVGLHIRKAEQENLFLAVRALPRTHPDYYALDLLNLILGGKQTSRLFLAMRETSGLVYDVSSGYAPYSDTGVLSIATGLAKENVATGLHDILKELKALTECEVPAPEL